MLLVTVPTLPLFSHFATCDAAQAVQFVLDVIPLTVSPHICLDTGLGMGPQVCVYIISLF